ncbi:MFS transporter [Methylobacterium dankookense]|uniref:Multidrug resistance protein MdtH n=2 Tax=Methylobacterium dankookense TaxID=560405 RepID=A0A564FSW7_9HYPH|nr:MFS transporter [Methylobacterium dankookense]VUF11142.1 Multidrug resistance protein MdtH [Methylobacterium dankookense]
MSHPAPDAAPATRRGTPTLAGNAALGVTQIILWGGSFFLIAVVADPIVQSTGWPQAVVVGALSLAILISGLLSPWVGRMIRRHGGRPVLIAGTLTMAAGLVLMGLAPNLPVFLLAWTVMGLGMAGALYDPLFAAIGQAYGSAARGAMTQIAIASGFAVTLCWPATSAMVAQIGWRGACFAYAALSVAVVAPLFAWALPRQARAEAVPAVAAATLARPAAPARLPGERVLAVTFTTAAVLMTAVSVQLLLLLQAQGIAAGTAVALSALIGPSQVGARILELAFGRGAHPIWALLVSSGSVALGLLLLAVAPGLAWLAIILYGAGNGMRTVVRGTLPLALYGQQDYAAVMGRLARLPLFGQAATPVACGALSDWLGLDALLDIMLGIAALNLALSLFVARRTLAERRG